MWAKRIRQQSWQFPQGGIRAGETPEQAMYRELHEEVGLLPEHVELVGSTKDWLRYRLPARLVRRHRKPTCIGQKQIWFLLRLRGEESNVCLDHSDQPEFDHWCWVDYWYPMFAVVSFKRQVYRRALSELAPLLFPEDHAKARPPAMADRTSNGSALDKQNSAGNSANNAANNSSEQSGRSKNRSQDRRSRLLRRQPYSSSHNNR